MFLWKRSGCELYGEMELKECSVLLAIFYTGELKGHFEQIIDFNLAPKNRG